MSLKPQPLDAIPEQTARIAKAAFPKGNLCLTLRDELGTLFCDEHFSDLFPTRGQPAQAPWRLALVTILQVVENLPDRQAAEAVRSRIDWKYLLVLPLTDTGFDASVLCEFRARLLSGQAESRLFERLLDLFKERGWVKARGKQRTECLRLVDKSLAAKRCDGPFLLHTGPGHNEAGFKMLNDYMRHANEILSSRHLSSILSTGDKFPGDYKDLMGYYSWGSNDWKFDKRAYNSLGFAPGASPKQ